MPLTCFQQALPLEWWLLCIRKRQFCYYLWIYCHMTQPVIIFLLTFKWNICQSVCWNCVLFATTIVVPRCSIQLFICRPQASWKPGMRFCSFKSLRAQVIVAEARLNRIYSFSLLGHLTDWYRSSSPWVPQAQHSIYAVLCADSSQCKTCPIPTEGDFWHPSTAPAGGSLGEIWGF